MKKNYLFCAIVFKSESKAWASAIVAAGIYKPNKLTIMLKNSDLYDGEVTRPYNKWSDVKLSLETRRIKTAMTDNPLFPDATPSIEVFGDAIDDYVWQLSRAGTHDSNAIAAKNVRRAKLIDLVVELGYSVSKTAKGNVEALVSTGLPLKKRRQAIVLAPPANFRIISGLNAGELT